MRDIKHEEVTAKPRPNNPEGGDDCLATRHSYLAIDERFAHSFQSERMVKFVSVGLRKRVQPKGPS